MNKKQPMYPDLSLYKSYLERNADNSRSPRFPDVTKKATIEYMNYAANICEKWDSFLDIGGGTGHYSAGLSALFKGGTVIEVERHDEQLAQAKRNPNIRFANQMIEDYADQKVVDFILLADVFEHIRQIDAFASHLSRLQEKGGVVYIMTPNPIFCGPAPESTIHHTRHANGHIKHYTRSEICSIMSREGYELVFAAYDESRFRESVKGLIRGLSRRDQKLRSNRILRILSPLVSPFALALRLVAQPMVYRVEKRIRNDEFKGRTQNLAFKKMR